MKNLFILIGVLIMNANAPYHGGHIAAGNLVSPEDLQSITRRVPDSDSSMVSGLFAQIPVLDKIDNDEKQNEKFANSTFAPILKKIGGQIVRTAIAKQLEIQRQEKILPDSDSDTFDNLPSAYLNMDTLALRSSYRSFLNTAHYRFQTVVTDINESLVNIQNLYIMHVFGQIANPKSIQGKSAKEIDEYLTNIKTMLDNFYSVIRKKCNIEFHYFLSSMLKSDYQGQNERNQLLFCAKLLQLLSPLPQNEEERKISSEEIQTAKNGVFSWLIKPVPGQTSQAEALKVILQGYLPRLQKIMSGKSVTLNMVTTPVLVPTEVIQSVALDIEKIIREFEPFPIELSKPVIVIHQALEEIILFNIVNSTRIKTAIEKAQALLDHVSSAEISTKQEPVSEKVVAQDSEQPLVTSATASKPETLAAVTSSQTETQIDVRDSLFSWYEEPTPETKSGNEVLKLMADVYLEQLYQLAQGKKPNYDAELTPEIPTKDMIQATATYIEKILAKFEPFPSELRSASLEIHNLLLQDSIFDARKIKSTIEKVKELTKETVSAAEKLNESTQTIRTSLSELFVDYLNPLAENLTESKAINRPSTPRDIAKIATATISQLTTLNPQLPAPIQKIIEKITPIVNSIQYTMETNSEARTIEIIYKLKSKIDMFNALFSEFKIELYKNFQTKL